MNLAIKGHPERGNEVIEILEMLGGKNIHRIDAIRDYYVYFVMDDKNKTISSLKLNQVLPEQFIIYSIEEFEEKFPYKVGDKVQYKGATSCGSIFEVEEMRWEENTVKYTLCLFGCNYKRSTLPAEYLQPYKEETMEEKGTLVQIDLTRELCVDDEVEVILGDYEFVLKDGKTYFVKKKPQYPKTYEECCNVLGCDRNLVLGTMPMKYQVLINFQKLLICRNAYWKIAGEEMGLGKDWDSRYGCGEWGYWIGYSVIENKIDLQDSRILVNHILVFPTEEMRDAFYENFKDLIKQCKKLL